MTTAFIQFTGKTKAAQMRRVAGLASEAVQRFPELLANRRSLACALSWLGRTAEAISCVEPEKAEIESWAVIYERSGRQKPHRHPGGWLSGVFYVAAPKLSGEGTHRGMLKLGMSDDLGSIEPPLGVYDIEPVPGRLVLFPSNVPHGTEPTRAEGERICVAFDVIPCRSDRPGDTN